jgi:hypothetical protein
MPTGIPSLRAYDLPLELLFVEDTWWKAQLMAVWCTGAAHHNNHPPDTATAFADTDAGLSTE